jgi:hypothetical protein
MSLKVTLEDKVVGSNVIIVVNWKHMLKYIFILYYLVHLNIKKYKCLFFNTHQIKTLILYLFLFIVFSDGDGLLLCCRTQVQMPTCSRSP